MKRTSATRKSPRRPARNQSKQVRVIAMLKRRNGTTINAIMKVTGWQAHSVRGFFAGVVRGKLGLNLQSSKTGKVREVRLRESPCGRHAEEGP